MKTLIMLMGIFVGWAQGQSAGPHGGVLVGDESHQLELSIDAPRSAVDLYVIKEERRLPDSLSLTLLDAKGNRRVFQLKALEAGVSSPLRFHGSLDASAQSFVGFEIQIPFNSEPPVVLRSN